MRHYNKAQNRLHIEMEGIAAAVTHLERHIAASEERETWQVKFRQQADGWYYRVLRGANTQLGYFDTIPWTGPFKSAEAAIKMGKKEARKRNAEVTGPIIKVCEA